MRWPFFVAVLALWFERTSRQTGRDSTKLKIENANPLIKEMPNMKFITRKQSDAQAGRVMEGLLRSAKSKFTGLLALTAILVTATFLRADSGRNKPEGNHLEGTWMGTGAPGVAPGLISFLSDGRVIWSRPTTV